MGIKYSIIIPVKAINDYVRETIPYIQKLPSSNWEVFILPNEKDPDEWQDARIKIISSGTVGPADKRDQGAKLAQGEILVFLDDDSYPEPNLLEIADQYFSKKEITAIGGPAMTPPHDSFWQKVSGTVFLSKVGGGIPSRYVPLGSAREVDDWPSVNLMIRKKDFLEVGGFDSKYWPGEDTKLCLELIKKSKKIIYVPELKVWHHRRTGFLRHLRQVGNYGLHRGFFAKKYPETSRKLIYFIPSLFVIFVIISLGNYWYPGWLQRLIIIGWGLYGLALFKAGLDFWKHEKNILIIFWAIIYTFFTHLSYGINFIKGFLFKKNLISKFRQ